MSEPTIDADKGKRTLSKQLEQLQQLVDKLSGYLPRRLSSIALQDVVDRWQYLAAMTFAAIETGMNARYAVKNLRNTSATLLDLLRKHGRDTGEGVFQLGLTEVIQVADNIKEG